MFKIKLYLFLSRIFPSFRKQMIQSKIKAIENKIITYMNDFKGIENFKLINILKNPQSLDLFNIRLDYRLDDINFSIGLHYENNEFEKLCDTPPIIGNRINEFASIANFLIYFKQLSENDLTTIIEFGK